MKKIITITAEDNIGRTESITLKLPELVAERLRKAAAHIDSSCLEDELSRLYDDYKMGYSHILSRSQYYRLRDFYDLIYHKFYNYTLNIQKK